MASLVWPSSFFNLPQKTVRGFPGPPKTVLPQAVLKGGMLLPWFGLDASPSICPRDVGKTEAHRIPFTAPELFFFFLSFFTM